MQGRNALSYWLFWASLFGSVGIVGLALNSGNDDYSLWLLVVALLMMGVGSAVSVGGDLRHPLVWFNGCFVAYSIGAPVVGLVSSKTLETEPYAYALHLQYLALCVFSLVSLRQRVEHDGLDVAGLRVFALGSIPLLVISSLITIPYLYSYFGLRLATKLDRHLPDQEFYATDFGYGILTIGFSAYMIHALKTRGRLPIGVLLVTAAFLLVSFLIGGERYIVVRLAVVCLVIRSTFGKKASKTLTWLTLFLIVGLAMVAQIFKNVLVSGQVGSLPNLDGWDSISFAAVLVIVLLGSEFSTVSDNLAILVSDVPSNRDFWYGEAFLQELSAVTRLGFLHGREDIDSVANWFSKTYFPAFYEMGGGMGFSLVGQGYLDMGVIGVIVLFTALGLGVRWLYGKSGQGWGWYIAYINLIPVLLYSIRQTTGTIASQGVKQVLLALLLMAMLGYLVVAAMSRKESKKYVT